MKMPFGIHKGKELEDVPTAYLLWFAENITGQDVLVKEVEEQLAMREGRGREVKRS